MSKYGNVTGSKDEWITPEWITKSLGIFDLDPCAPNPKAAPYLFAAMWQHARKSFYLPDYDGLREEWEGRVWLNPPYLKQAAWPWVAKLASHGSGIALVNSTTDTVGFQREVLEKARAVLFIKGRISFYNANGTKSGMPMQGSVLAAYSKKDADALHRSGIPGVVR